MTDGDRVRESLAPPRVALVTGAGGGIGGAVVARLVEDGYLVAAVDLPGRTPAQHDMICPIDADVADPAQVRQAFASTIDHFARLDVVVNNAGVEGPIAGLADLNIDDFDRVMAINVRAAVLFTQLALAHMRDHDGGVIVNVASIAGLRASDGVPTYVISKHALVGLTRAAAREAATTGVRVNAVCPGPIDTQMMASIEAGLAPADPTADRRARELRIPLGRYGRVGEVAEAVSWLCSPATSFMNGSCVVIDGGSSA